MKTFKEFLNEARGFKKEDFKFTTSDGVKARIITDDRGSLLVQGSENSKTVVMDISPQELEKVKEMVSGKTAKMMVRFKTDNGRITFGHESKGKLAGIFLEPSDGNTIFIDLNDPSAKGISKSIFEG